MKKKIFNIYTLILLFFILFLFINIIQWSFSSEITPLFLILNAILVIVAGIAFTFELVLSMIITAFIVLIYAAYIFIQIYKGNILGRSALEDYMWFLILPITAFLAGYLRLEFKTLNEKVINYEKNISEHSLKDKNTLLYNKSELIIDLKKNFDFFKKKNVYFTTIILSIENYDLLIKILNNEEKENFQQKISEGIFSCTRSYAKRYYLGDGLYAILILGEDDESLKEKVREFMDKYLNFMKFRNIEKINVKYSAKAIDVNYKTYVEYYRDLIKGLEFDV